MSEEPGYFAHLVQEANQVKASRPLHIDLAFEHSALVPDLVSKILHLEIQLADERAEYFKLTGKRWFER